MLTFNAKTTDFKSFKKNAEELEEKFSLDKDSLEVVTSLMMDHFTLNEDVKEKYLAFYEHLVGVLNNTQIRNFKGDYVFALVKMFIKEGRLSMVQDLVYWIHAEMCNREEMQDALLFEEK